MARARMPDKWAQYLGCMSDHLSLRKIIDRIKSSHGVSLAEPLPQGSGPENAAVLSGVIEADETYFVQSFKGNRG